MGAKVSSDRSSSNHHDMLHLWSPVGCVKLVRTIACAGQGVSVHPSHYKPMAAGSDLGILKEKVAKARSLTILTGAGISADSGSRPFEARTAYGVPFVRKISPRPRRSSGTRAWCGNGTTG